MTKVFVPRLARGCGEVETGSQHSAPGPRMHSSHTPQLLETGNPHAYCLHFGGLLGWLGAGRRGRESHLVDHSRAVSADLQAPFHAMSVHYRGTSTIRHCPTIHTASCGNNGDSLSFRYSEWQPRTASSCLKMSDSSREAEAV